MSAILLITRRTDLAEAVRRVVTATGRTLEVTATAAASAPWRRAELVLVGVDEVGAVLALDPLRRPGVVVVSTGIVPDAAWRDALLVGAEEVLVLPDADHWLVDRIGSGTDAGPTALVVGVLGGRGGAGASFLAAALAACAARSTPSQVALVDLDRWGGGVDLLLGAGAEPGLRWTDLADVRGRVPWAALDGNLPRPGGVHVVTFDRSGSPADPEPEGVRSVLGAARAGTALVVVDLPRSGPVLTDVLSRLDVAVVVTTADVRGCLSARTVVQELMPSLDHVVLGVRRPGRGGLPAELVQEVVGCSITLDVPELSGADRRIGRGQAAFGSGASVRRVLDAVRGLRADADRRAA